MNRSKPVEPASSGSRSRSRTRIRASWPPASAQRRRSQCGGLVGKAVEDLREAVDVAGGHDVEVAAFDDVAAAGEAGVGEGERAPSRPLRAARGASPEGGGGPAAARGAAFRSRRRRPRRAWHRSSRRRRRVPPPSPRSAPPSARRTSPTGPGRRRGVPGSLARRLRASRSGPREGVASTTRSRCPALRRDRATAATPLRRAGGARRRSARPRRAGARRRHPGRRATGAAARACPGPPRLLGPARHPSSRPRRRGRRAGASPLRGSPTGWRGRSAHAAASEGPRQRSRKEIGCAPSQSVRRPSSRRCSVPSTSVAKWLAHSCPALLAKLQ